MKFTNWLTVGALTVSLVSPVMADEIVSSLSESQKKEIEQVIHNYLTTNPEVLLEASQALQQKQQQNMQKQAQSAIQENKDQLFQGKLSTVGNPKGNVTVVEFFDYQCVHCKKMSPILTSLIKKDSNLRVIYKELPIFGKNSELASKAALAAGMQGKYKAMHDALLAIEQRLNDENVMNAAKSIGLDMKKLEQDMAGKEVKEALAANRSLAEKLHLMGTPAFIVAATPKGQFKVGSEPSFIPGAASEKSLQELIKKAADN